MTFLEAAFDILRKEGRPLHYKDLTERALGKKLLTFVGRTPEVTMQTQLTAAVKKAPGNPFVRVKPGIFGLLRYPEISAEEREAERVATTGRAAPERPERAERAERAERPERKAAESDGAAETGEAGRRRRRRRGRGRPGAETAETARPAEAGAAESVAPVDDGEDDEPAHRGLSAEARAAALAETGVLEADADDGAGEEEDETSMEDDEIPTGAPEAPKAGGQAAAGATTDAPDPSEADDGELEGEGDEELGDEAEPGVGAEAREPGGELGPGRRRRRRRRGRGRGEGEGAPVTRTGEGGAPAGASSESMSFGEGGAATSAALDTSGASSEEPTGGASLAPLGGEDRQGPRRIMTPVDAALEILRGQAPGRGVHVRQIADAAARRKLIHGEPNEAWRVMRTALAAEPRERLRAGFRPRIRAAGAGLYALARRPPDGELERAEQVFGEARRALRERTVAALERRIAELPASAFEALARVLLQREGFGPATFVKRVDGTIYVEAMRGRGARPSKCLVGLRFGSSSGGRRSIGELRAGIRARGQDEGVLMLAGRLAEDAISEWKQAGPPIEIADGPAMAETCIRHGVGVINTMVSVDFVDADFFADIAEG